MGKKNCSVTHLKYCFGVLVENETLVVHCPNPYLHCVVLGKGSNYARPLATVVIETFRCYSYVERLPNTVKQRYLEKLLVGCVDPFLLSSMQGNSLATTTMLPPAMASDAVPYLVLQTSLSLQKSESWPASIWKLSIIFSSGWVTDIQSWCLDGRKTYCNKQLVFMFIAIHIYIYKVYNIIGIFCSLPRYDILTSVTTPFKLLGDVPRH